MEMTNSFWSTDGIPEEIKSQIRKRITLAKIVVIGVNLNTFVAGIIAFAILLLPHWPIFLNCSLWHCTMFCSLTLLAFLGFALIIYALAFAGLYWAMHLTIQLRLLSAYFDAIGDDVLNLDDEEKRDSVLYQTEIRRRLIFGIKQHMRLVRLV